MIPFNKPAYIGIEDKYILESLKSGKLSGDGFFSKRCQKWFEENSFTHKALLTPNCTQALEMAAILMDIKAGDEVIMPSYTFVSTANAFVLRGAKVVFVDIRKDTMNIDENLIEAAITENTKAIIPVHYAGVACEMDTIMSIAKQYNLFVVEDAAQGMQATYKGKALGTIGHFGAYSFHETKNYTSGGEGGLLLINDQRYVKRAEIIREKGTNRSLFFRGMVDKYSWVDVGSSFLPCELQAACLWGQLENVDKINNDRLNSWSDYYNQFKELVARKLVSLPFIPENCQHNAHMFYLKVSDLDKRAKLLSYLKERDISAAFHYIPLHSAQAGIEYSQFIGSDNYTTSESEKLVRLPLYFGLSGVERATVVKAIYEFFDES